MARFEQRISEDDVTAARKKIEAGASLRSAAAEIPCAPSTLSVRIRKAEAAEADARGGAAIGENKHHAAHRDSELPDARLLAAGEGALPGEVGPVETMRGALLATRADGQADWPTRLSAAKALAALRPEELEPKKEKPSKEPSIEVYDLPAGAVPVLHRAALEGGEALVSDADASSEQPPTSPSAHMFRYEPADGESVSIGSWFPPYTDQSAAAVPFHIRITGDHETAERWRAELSAGRFPKGSEDPS